MVLSVVSIKHAGNYLVRSTARQSLRARFHLLQPAARAAKLRNQQPPCSLGPVTLRKLSRAQIRVVTADEAHDADAIPGEIAQGAAVPFRAVIVIAHENI